MNITLPETFFDRIPNITPGAVKTYLCLSWLKATEKQLPTQPDIATHMNASQRSVVRYLQELERAGYIKKRRIGSGRRTDYVLVTKHVYGV
ncbi:MAG: helix-turn-helix domain-containing protein [Candidatus Thiodiazotropha sp. (ex Lucinoma borealis)]|nr:helix-turn-helix domain-containing protein [Candidatus Thiodiazotropha sp. (ex Lucinoma borealis)]